MGSQYSPLIEVDLQALAARLSTKGSNVETADVDPSGDKNVSLKPTMGLYVQRQNTTVLVALGKICEGGSAIHNVTYADDVVRVSVDKVIEGDAEVPFPTSEIQYVKQALQTFIAWPTNLVKKVSHEESDTSPKKLPETDERGTNDFDHDPLRQLTKSLYFMYDTPVELKIWTYDTSTPVSRNATIYCSTEILSLDWECKSDRLLLIGTSDGCIKAWNVDAKRVVCDLNTTEAFPSVLDIKCSPVEPIFVSAAASGGAGSNYIDNLGFASLTVWNMKTWKAMTVLPLGEDPPAITSLCFNHNGKILAASAVDGMIHMFDMSAGLQITGWPAHDSSISSILFGPDETSIFSLGSDGKIFEWSLQNQGQILWSRDSSRFCYPLNDSKYCRHEMALDANGRRLLVTSSSFRAPIYQVNDSW
ncbi:WD repeat-containing protein 91 homolog [Glycine soja]|nr:WD repeat-containing protein 91 homolog [Glycine soja]